MLWIDEILHGKPLFVGIYRGNIIPGFLWWCEMDLVHPQYVSFKQKGIYCTDWAVWALRSEADASEEETIEHPDKPARASKPKNRVRA